MFLKNLCFRISFVIIALISSENLFAQKTLRINGQISTEDGGQPIFNANIILKSKTGALIFFKSSDKNGNFLFEIKSNARDFILETSSIGFQKNSHVLFFKDGIDTINIFIVLKTAITSLPEIIIAAKPAAITIKKDTTKYKVSDFLTGNEEVVEDVLKKLPGIEVSENGKITYKGKSISKVLIEGDDLFSKNYQIGTKNIKSTLLNEVEAIDNYVENEKLVGFEKTNETVLNLKVKNDYKNKPNLSASLAYGHKNNFQIDNNLIGIGKSFKYFLFNNANNVGVNPTPYNYFNFNNTAEESSELTMNQTRIVEIDYTLPILNPKRGNINQNYFSTGNSFIRFNKNFNITLNYNLYADKVSTITNNLTEYGNIAQGISFSEQKSIYRKPLIGSLAFNILHNISKKSNIRYISSFNISKIENSERLIANYGNFSNYLKDRNTSFEQDLDYTNRLSINSVLKIKANYLNISQPQNYILSPNLNIANISLNNQHINIISNVFDINSEYFYKNRRFLHSLTIQYNKKTDEMNSYLFESKLYNNNLTKNDDNFNFGYKNTLDLNKIQLSASVFYNFKNSNILGNEIIPLRNNISFLTPNVNLQYKVNKYDKIILASSYDRFLPELTDVYQNYILINNKSLARGIYQNSVINRYSLVSTFIHSDLFNQFIYFLNFIYSKNSKSYGSSQEINSNYIINNKSIFPGVENYILTGSLSKYLPFINSTIKYNGNLSKYQFYTQVNNPMIKNNFAFNSSQTLGLKSGFDGIFDFETELKYSITKFSSSKSSAKNVDHYLNFLFRPTERLFFSISNEIYFNNLTSNNYNKYYFLDLDIKYSLNKKATIKLIGKNLTDNKFFSAKIIDQLSISSNSYSLLPAMVLFELSYRF